MHATFLETRETGKRPSTAINPPTNEAYRTLESRLAEVEQALSVKVKNTVSQEHVNSLETLFKSQIQMLQEQLAQMSANERDITSRIHSLDHLIKLQNEVIKAQAAELKRISKQWSHEIQRISYGLNTLTYDLTEESSWETIEVTWTVRDRISDLWRRSKGLDNFHLESETFCVAGYEMSLQIYVSGSADILCEWNRPLGLYLCHKGGANCFPLKIGKTSISLTNLGLERTFGARAEIQGRKGRQGWSNITTIGHLYRIATIKSHYKIVIKASVRVKRTCHVSVSSSSNRQLNSAPNSHRYLNYGQGAW